MNQFLFSPTKQFIYPSGKILVGGKIYVFIKHTNTLATLYNDEGVEIANPVVLDSNGRATVLADENYDYKLDVYTSDGELLFTAASYMTDQYERDIAIISTDGSVDITPSVSGYTDVWDLSVSSEIQNQINEFRTNEFEPAITGLSGAVDYVSATFDSFTGSIPSFDDKLDTTAFTDFTANNYEPTITDIKGGINEISSFVSDCCSSLPNTYVPYSATTITTASTAQLVDSDTVQTMIDQSTSAIDTFSGVSADSTLTGNGKTSALGVNMLMLTGMLDNAKNEAVASAQSGLIRDIDFMLQNVVIYPDTMSGYNDDGTVWLKYHWGCEGSTEASGNELDNYYEGSIRTNYISMAPSALEVFNSVRTNSGAWNEASAGNVEVNNVVETNSAHWNESYTALTSNSGDWNSVYDTVESNSASWVTEAFTGVDTDTTLTGNGKDTPLGVAEVQSLTSDNSISITSGVDSVILGVNSSWFDNAVNSAFTGAQGDAEVNTYVHNNSATINEVNTTVQSNSASWSQGTTYSSVSGTVIVSGSDLEISQPAIRTGVPWIIDGWSHSYDDSTAFNAGFQKQYNSYRLTHYMYSRQYPNPAHTGFSATLIQQDENYNVLSSTQLNGIFDFEFTPVANCDIIWLYCSGTSAECQQGVQEYYRDGNSQKWVENLAWETDTPTRDEFANLYENIAVNSGDWGGGSVDTVPFIVQSPLITGFSGTSAYIGLDGEAFESSAYVPVSSLTFANNYLTQISGKTISAYTARNAYTATYATTATRATNDINGNSITATYQPKLTIAGVDGTITAINNSAVGADVPSGFELVAGANISIVDDAQNSATTISVSGISAAEWNDCYETVETNSATWGGGGTSYTGDAQGALDEVYTNSGNWNGTYNTVMVNSGTWGGSSSGNNYFVKYGVSTFDEVSAAVDAGYYVICDMGDGHPYETYVPFDMMTIYDGSYRIKFGKAGESYDGDPMMSCIEVVQNDSTGTWSNDYYFWNDKQNVLTFGYDTDNTISSINGSALAGGGGYTPTYHGIEI